MRATSACLEVYVEIDSWELERLESKPLLGTLNFRDDITPLKNQIPIVIERVSGQRKFLEVEQEPTNIYFGEANKIKFTINSEYYDNLITNKSFGARFSVGGKLVMKLRGS